MQCRNLQSALLRPGIVAEKFQTELAAGRFTGPFDHPLFQNFMFLLWSYVRKKNQISLEWSTTWLIRKGALLMILYHQNILRCNILGFSMQFLPWKCINLMYIWQNVTLKWHTGTYHFHRMSIINLVLFGTTIIIMISVL